MLKNTHSSTCRGSRSGACWPFSFRWGPNLGKAERIARGLGGGDGLNVSSVHRCPSAYVDREGRSRGGGPRTGCGLEAGKEERRAGTSDTERPW